jgi:hypothetical protein
METAVPPPIVLPEENLKSGEPQEIVSAVQEYAYNMNRLGVDDRRLPIRVLQSSYCEFYMIEVQNGNIGQFVVNSRWDPALVEVVRTGLNAMGPRSQATLFEDVIRFVESTRTDLLTALSSTEDEGRGALIKDGKRFQLISQVVVGEFDGEFGKMIADVVSGELASRSPIGPREAYRERLDALGGGFFKNFTAHPEGYRVGSDQIRFANAAWIKSWPDVTLVRRKNWETALQKAANGERPVSKPSGLRRLLPWNR